ncbi:MAG: hypothetical protein RLZZ422_1241 [Pseudomonadota bacterium]|jgi:hypothetical protein
MFNNIYGINSGPWGGWGSPFGFGGYPSQFPAFPAYPTGYPSNGAFYSVPLSRLASGYPAAPVTPQQRSNMENLLGLNVAYVADMDISGYLSEGDVALSESWGTADASVRLSQAMIDQIG